MPQAGQVTDSAYGAVVIAAVVVVLVVALVVAVVVAVAMEPGALPTDVAVAYEEAWDRLDFEALWTLSGEELRDGLDRRGFVGAKAQAYGRQLALTNLARRITVEDVRIARSVALACTRVELRDGGVTRNEVEMARRGGRWVVVGYHLRFDTEDERPGEHGRG